MKLSHSALSYGLPGGSCWEPCRAPAEAQHTHAMHTVRRDRSDALDPAVADAERWLALAAPLPICCAASDRRTSPPLAARRRRALPPDKRIHVAAGCR